MDLSGLEHLSQRHADHIARNRLIASCNPFVIDAQSCFRERSQSHSSACGWLAVYVYLLFLKYRGKLHPSIVDKLDTPGRLKEATGTLTRDVSIDSDQLQLLADYLQVKIIIPSVGVKGGLSDIVYSHPNPHHTFYLWLYSDHHTVELTEMDDIAAVPAFVQGFNTYNTFNIRIKAERLQTHPYIEIPDCSGDEILARSLSQSFGPLEPYQKPYQKPYHEQNEILNLSEEDQYNIILARSVREI
jgi:hypothetical protein